MTRLLPILCAALTGCTIVPIGTAMSACDLLATASNEADLAPAWYSHAGEVLERCGVPKARETGEERACAANKRNGYECQETKE